MARSPNDRVTISYRIPERLRARIEAAAELDGLNITQEMTKCIEYSLDEEQRMVANSPLIKMQAQAIRQCEEITGKKWHEDGVTAQRVKKAMLGMLDLIIPFTLLDTMFAWGEDNEKTDLLNTLAATMESLDNASGPEVEKFYDGAAAFVARFQDILAKRDGGASTPVAKD